MQMVSIHRSLSSEGGFYFKTLRKTNSQVIINIKNEGENFYDAIISQGTDAKLEEK